MSHSHRPTTKQQHKPFKSGHASSRTLKDISKGKIQQEKATGCVQKVHTKKDRKNLAKQIQQNKKVALKAQAGYFGDNIAKAARVCALISLSQAAKPQYFVNGLQGYLEEPVTESANANVHIKNFKQRLQFVSPHADTITAILDVASIADTTIFLISAGDSLARNDRAREVLRALQSQGISSHFSVIPDLKYDPDSMVERTEKRCLELRKMWEADLEQYFPVHHANSLYVMDSTAEIANMLRTVCTTNPDSPSWRVSRTYIVPTARDFDSDGNFFVEGIVRGGSLSADRTVHIPSLGDFQIARVTNIPAGIEEERALATPTDKQDSFTGPHEDVDMVTAATAAAETDTNNNQDGMLAEDRLRRGVRLDDHYYMEDGEEEVPVVKKVPRGTSEYQATWITDENALNSDEESSEDDDEDMEGNASDDQDDIMSVAGAGAGAPSTYAPTQFEEAHEDLSEEEEARQLAQYQAQVRDDKEFPDEVDFDPHTTTARERFIKYRGLKDFHQSQWDPEEAEPNTPAWYGDILKFTNYKATRNRILKARGSVGLGARVRLHLKDVPRSILDSSLPSSSSSSLLDGRGDGSCVPVVWINREHEQARAINNLTIRLEPDVAPLKSKADLVIQVGHRRFVAQPVFSQAIPRTGNGLVRYERFCQPGRISFATFAGPGIMEKGCPVLFFHSPSSSSSIDGGGGADRDGKEGTGDLRLVGTGSFDGIDHTRLLIKRVLLTATPFKIHKRLVTLRYMFHDREDVLFFAAIQLRTKYGRTGFIKEPLGTHGYMKTTWDKQLQGVDTVLMPLYKRIYPRDAHYFL